MKRGASILGLLLIAAGAAALVWVNVRLLPQVLQMPEPGPKTSGLVAVHSVPSPIARPPASAPQAVPSAGLAASAALSASAAPSLSASAAAGSTQSQAVFASIKFEPGDARKRGLAVQLRATAATMKQNPAARLVVVGHGDADTPAKDYLELGARRARAVRDSLLDFRVPVSRMSIEAPAVQGEEVQSRSPGVVEVRIVSKEKGEGHVP